MPLTRRQTLALFGGGVILAATGAITTFLTTRTPTKALQPWQIAGQGYADPRLDTVSWAILAPNPHNRQPWIVRLDGDDGFTLYADPERRLPTTDPFDRQIAIGLGCFLEIARQAAAQNGFRLNVEPFPEGENAERLDQRPVARARLLSGGNADPLFAHVAARRSCKEPYDMARPVSDGTMNTVLTSAGAGVRAAGTANAAKVTDLRNLGWRGHVIEIETPRTLQESIDLMRLGRAEIEAHPDGIDLGGPFLETLNLTGLLTRESMADRTSESYRQGLEMYRALFDNTPAFVWLATAGNTRRDHLAAGAAWVRMNLAATGLGVAMHPISQTLQEYPEMAALYAEAHERLANPGETVQMLGRLGYGPTVAPSPRWPLTTRIETA